jgi:hypothetical protein
MTVAETACWDMTNLPGDKVDYGIGSSRRLHYAYIHTHVLYSRMGIQNLVIVPFKQEYAR